MGTAAAAVTPGSPPAAWHTPAIGSVHVVRSGGRSRVVRAFATSPLRLLTPRNHGHAAWVYTSSFGGGLVGGDHLKTTIIVEPGAAAFVSTQSSTKVYRSPLGAVSDCDARVAAGGLLVLAPDPVVCFAASGYRQRQRFELDGEAALVLVDWLTSGRRAAGERWAFDEYASTLDVRRDGKRLVYDAMMLRASDGRLGDRLGRHDVLATVAVIGPTLRDASAAAAKKVGQLPLGRLAPMIASAAPLPAATSGDDGWLMRIAGPSVETVGAFIRDCLAFVPGLLGDDPWARKW